MEIQNLLENYTSKKKSEQQPAASSQQQAGIVVLLIMWSKISVCLENKTQHAWRTAEQAKASKQAGMRRAVLVKAPSNIGREVIRSGYS